MLFNRYVSLLFLGDPTYAYPSIADEESEPGIPAAGSTAIRMASESISNSLASGKIVHCFMFRIQLLYMHEPELGKTFVGDLIAGCHIKRSQMCQVSKMRKYIIGNVSAELHINVCEGVVIVYYLN